MSTSEQLSPVSVREQILDAAMDCITERGFDRATIDDIAARSGLSPAEVREHFVDEAEIRVALSNVLSELLSAWMGSA
ncbi:MAG TPA: helix-turn-helix domain-containing protein [Dehalococcoidia bacterium]